MHKIRRWVIGLAAVAALAIAGCDGRAFESGRLLLTLTGPPRQAEGVRRQEIGYAVDGRRHRGDLYRAEDAPARAALVLVPGASPEGKDDPRFVAFAGALARARFVVLAPEIPDLRALRISAADAQAIGDAVRHLAATEPSGAGGVAVTALSYAAGPAMLAALDPESRPHVGLVVAVGAYHSMRATITFFTTGWHHDAAGRWRHREPNAYGKWVFVRSNAVRLADPGDRALLTAMARRRLASAAAPIDDLAAELGPAGRAVYALVVNEDPLRVPGLIAALPASIADEIAALDLAGRDLTRLRARVLLIHGRDDAIIPAGQSVALAAALPPGQAELHVVDSLSHVDLRAGGFSEALQMWRVAYRLLAARDAIGGS